MSEVMPKPESIEAAIERLQAERDTLQQTCIDQLWNADHGSPEDATKAREFFEKCLAATNQFVNNFIQPDFDKNENLEKTKQFYLEAITNNGSDFIKKGGWKIDVLQMMVVCRYVFDDKMLENRIQSLIISNEALKSMPKTSE